MPDISSFDLPQLPQELMESLPEVIQNYFKALHLLVKAQQSVIQTQLPLLQEQLEGLQKKLAENNDNPSEAGFKETAWKRPAKKSKGKIRSR